MSAYYEIEKPFSRENWNKLIRDLNEAFEIAPGSCENIEPLDEVEPEHIWTKQDVEEVREKLIEMCSENEFTEDLDKPWRRSIIDEIEAQIRWCGCDIGPWTLQTNYPQLGGCIGEHETESVPLTDLIDGMSVGPSGTLGRIWRVYHKHHETGGLISSSSIQGPVLCDGTIEYIPGGGGPGWDIPLSWDFNYHCYTYGCACGAWLRFIMGDEWCAATEAACEIAKAEANENALAEAVAEVAEKNANGEYHEWTLHVVSGLLTPC